MKNVDLVAVAIFISLSIITVCVVVNSIDMLRNGRIYKEREGLIRWKDLE